MSGRVVPTTVILEESVGRLRTMDSFFSSGVDAPTLKRTRIEMTESFERELLVEERCSNISDTLVFPNTHTDPQNEIPNEEIHPAGLDDIGEGIY